MAIALGDALHKKGACLPVQQLAVQLLHQRIQGYVRETRRIPQLCVNRIGYEYFLERMLEKGQPDHPSTHSYGSAVSVLQRQS